MAKNKTELSLVIPAYKEEAGIAGRLKSIDKQLNKLFSYYEIICVVDGSPDKTYQNAKKLSRQGNKRITIYTYKKNVGKGFAVRYGLERANGEIIGFIDSGREISPNSIPMLLEHMNWYKADVIIGSKRHPVSKVKYPLLRKILSVGYQFGVKVLFGLNIRDTQVGIKFFRKEVVKDVVPRLLVKMYAFDIEFLAVANSLGYKRIYEAPFELHYDFNSLVKASTMRNILNMLWDTLAVFYRLKIIHYYDKFGKKKKIAIN